MSWYETIAFCRWLSDRTARVISLPTERGFERAARGPTWRPTDETHDYPWRDVVTSGRANFDETTNEVGDLYLQRTSAVGVYPLGRSAEGIEDLAGNAWEWCLNEYNKPDNTACEGGDYRAYCGGSWRDNQFDCYSAFPHGTVPDYRLNYIGFRLSCLSPISDR